jgi:hypothetical protein
MSGGLGGDRVVVIGLGRFGYDLLLETKRAVADLAQECGHTANTFTERRLVFLAIDFGHRTELPAGEHLTLPIITRPPERGKVKLDPALLPTDLSPMVQPGVAAYAWLSILSREAQVLGRLRDLVDELHLGGGQVWRTYLVGSATEPETTGLLLPVGNLIRRMFRADDERRDLLRQCAVLVVPPDLDDHGKAQAVATLREVSMAEACEWPDPVSDGVYRDRDEGERHVFDLGCYLVEKAQEGSGRHAPATFGEQKMAVAEWLAYQCVPEVQASLQEGRLGQPRRVGGSPIDETDQVASGAESRGAPAFASLGFADYVVPVSRVVEACAVRLAGSLVEETLLAGSEEGRGSDADRLVDGLDAARLQDEMADSPDGRTLFQFLVQTDAFPWKKPGGVIDAWRCREVLELDEFPRQIEGLRRWGETRAERAGRDIETESRRVAAERPAGALARAAAAVRVGGTRLLGLEANARRESVEEGERALGLFSRLAAERRRARAYDAALPILRRMTIVFAITGVAALALHFVLAWIVQRFWPNYAPTGSLLDRIMQSILGQIDLDGIYSFVTAVGPSILAHAGSGAGAATGSLLRAVLNWLVRNLDPIAALWQFGCEVLFGAFGLFCTFLVFRCYVRRHVNAIREYLEAVRRSHILLLVALVQKRAGEKVVHVIGQLEELRAEIADTVSRLAPEPRHLSDAETSGGGLGYLDFPGRQSLVTSAVVDDVYRSGADKGLQGMRPALHALAEGILSPDRLYVWLTQPTAERDATLLTRCREVFAESSVPDAESRFIQRLLDEARRPEAETNDLVGREVQYRLFERMKPLSSHIEAETEPSQAIGLADPERSKLAEGIDMLRQSGGRLFRLTTGLRYRIVGFTFRQDVRLTDLRAYGDWEKAYAAVKDPNLLHTRLVFSGRPAPSPAPTPPPAPSLETLASLAAVGQAASYPTGGVGLLAEDDWAKAPEAIVPGFDPETSGRDRAVAQDPAGLGARCRLLGVKPEASAEEIEVAHWMLFALHALGRETDESIGRASGYGEAYDDLRDMRRVAGRPQMGGV